MTQNCSSAVPEFDEEAVVSLPAIRKIMPGFNSETLPAMREVLGASPEAKGIDLSAGGLVTQEVVTVPGPEGGPEVELLILRPSVSSTSLGGIYYMHGGGMVAGNRTSGIETFLPYVAEGHAVIVSVEYRLAPEHPYPAAVEDCFAGLTWMAKNLESLNVDEDRLMVAGISAGGGLAAAVALKARDEEYPQISHQVLTTPMLDDRSTTPSSQMLDHDGVWDKHDNDFGWDALLGDQRGGADVSCYAAPARATDLSNLPPTYLDCGSAETFRDEIIDFAARLSNCGVSVDLHMWAGGFHRFDNLAPNAGVSKASNATRDDFVRRALRVDKS